MSRCEYRSLIRPEEDTGSAAAAAAAGVIGSCEEPSVGSRN